ncbi:MAG: hypothetical protein V2I33_16615 [Kangiellaceae bacterium]|nr:hypothetical protein [Kangiellaceae bacterium]
MGTANCHCVANTALESSWVNTSALVSVSAMRSENNIPDEYFHADSS